MDQVTFFLFCFYLCLGTHVYIQVKGQAWCWEPLPFVLQSLIHWVKDSQSNPELSDMANLASQLALGIFCVFFPRLELQTGCYTHERFCWFWGHQLWSSCLCGKHVTSEPSSSPSIFSCTILSVGFLKTAIQQVHLWAVIAGLVNLVKSGSTGGPHFCACLYGCSKGRSAK